MHERRQSMTYFSHQQAASQRLQLRGHDHQAFDSFLEIL